jgi:hypothetical protein
MAGSSADRLRMRFDLLDADGSGTLTSADFDLFASRVRTVPAESPKAQALALACRRYWQGLGGTGRVSTRRFAGFLRAFYTGTDDLL